MGTSVSFLCEAILLGLIILHFVRALFSEDKSLIWSPISVISLTYIYYCSVPYWLGTIERYSIDEDVYNGYLFHIAALLSYSFILVGFQKNTSCEFTNWNRYFTIDNVKKYGIILFIAAMIGYSSFRGFHLSISNSSSTTELEAGGLVYYFIFMIDMCAIAAALMILSLKENYKQPILYIILILILVQIIFAGARWLIITVVITCLTVYYLYPRPTKINYLLLGPLAIALFLGFSIMDQTRVRGGGINMEKATALKYDDIKGGAQENYSVYYFSLMSMDKLYCSGERVYFRPFLTAALMPIPRSIFPWKPDAEYLHKIEDEVFGKGLGGGAAFLNFVEYYMAFGWIGIIVMSWIIGWLSKIFWNNYRQNPGSIGAIIALGSFSAVLYSVISRGYLAGTLPNVILVVFLPFGIVAFIRHFFSTQDEFVEFDE